jgi:hypothetical protein
VLGSFTVRRMRSAWLLVGCLTATVLVASALVSALVTFYTSALPAAVTSELPKSGPMAVAVSGVTGGGQTAAGVAGRLSASFRTVPTGVYAATWSNDLSVPRPPHDGQVPVIQAADVGGITANARLTAGHWPAAPHAGQPIPAALPTTAARDLGLQVGSVLSVTDPSTGYRWSLQVAGLYRAIRPTAPYWQIDSIGPTGATEDGGFLVYGPAVVSPAAFGGSARGLLNPTQLSDVALPKVGGIRMADLSPLAHEIAKAVSGMNNSGYLTATTEMPQLLANAAAGLATARSLVLISGLQLLLLACAALALASRLLASYREEETALLAARGAARRQLIRQSLTEATIEIVVSAAAGALAGSWLAAVLLSHLTGLPAQTPVPGGLAWLAAVVLAVVCLGIVVWPTLRPPRPSDVRTRRGRSAQLAVAISAGADIALIALALLAVRELRGYSAAAQVASGAGIDPVIAVAPALALAGFAIVPLRLLPIAARGLERLTARGSRFGSAMANWEISRRPLRQSGPALLVILAVGTSTLGLAQYESWRRSVHDQAAFSTGAQVSVQPPLFASAADGTRVARLPGVTAAMPVSAVQYAGVGQLLVLDAALAARTVTLRPDLSSVPAAALFAKITPRHPAGLVLPGRPARLALTASLSDPAGGTDAAALGPVSATLTVQDADGVSYAVQTTTIPADGRFHALVAGLSAAAAYPLRLTGISVSYNMPAYPQTALAASADQQAVLQLGGLAVSQRGTGPFATSFATGQAIAAWPAQSADPGLASALSGTSGLTYGSAKAEIGIQAAAGGIERITFSPGHGPLLSNPPPGTSATPQPGQAEVEINIPPSRQPVPVIATAGYAATNGLHHGSIFAVTIEGQQISCQLVATVAAFPGGGALVADQAAVQDALVNLGFGGSLPVTEWWLATVSGVAPPGLPAGWTVIDADAVASRLESDPLSAAPVHAAAAVALAVALLAALGFCVSVVASARERRSQHALLGALGVPAAAQARLFCVEEALISIPAAAVGLAIGVVLARVMVPALTVTATGAVPVPPVLLDLPLGLVLPLAAVLAVVPVAAAAVTALRQPDPAAELRAAEAMA